jgi:hypothetical protein
VAIDGVVGSMQHEGAEQQHEVPRHRGVARDVGRPICVGGDGMRPPICVAEATISGDERAHHEVPVHRLHQAPCVASASHRAALCATSTGPACPYMPPLPDATRSGCSEQVGQPSRASDRRCMPLHISSASRHAGGLLRARRLATMGCSQDVLLED